MFEAALGTLPDGVFVSQPGTPEKAFLIADGRLWRWSPGGYANAGVLSRAPSRVTVLRPRSIVRAIAAGYAPDRHRSVARIH
jgi:hypothetical protein